MRIKGGGRERVDQRERERWWEIEGESDGEGREEVGEREGWKWKERGGREGWRESDGREGWGDEGKGLEREGLREGGSDRGR